MLSAFGLNKPGAVYFPGQTGDALPKMGNEFDSMTTEQHNSETAGNDRFVTFIAGHHTEQIVEHLLMSPIMKYMDAEGQENAGTHVFVTINILRANILMVEVMQKPESALSESVIFHSLNLWQTDSNEFVVNMRDGIVSGFTIERLPSSVHTPEEFVCHILRDLFQGAEHPYDVNKVAQLCSWCRDTILNAGVKSAQTGDAVFCTESCLHEALNQHEPDEDIPELVFNYSGQLQVFSSAGYEGDIEIDELMEFAFRLKSADETGVSITIPDGGGQTRQTGYVNWSIEDEPRDDIRSDCEDLPETLIIHLENGPVLKADLHEMAVTISGLMCKHSEFEHKHVILTEV